MIGFSGPVPIPSRNESDVFWPACGLHVDPQRLPVRFELPGHTFLERALGITWAVTLYRDHLVLWRAAPLTQHVPLVLGLAGFDSVTVRAAQPDSETFRIAIFLAHSGLDMEIPVYAADHTDDVAALWHAWGRSLDLPLELVDADGIRRTPGGATPPAAAIGRLARRAHARSAARRPTGGRALPDARRVPGLVR